MPSENAQQALAILRDAGHYSPETAYRLESRALLKLRR